MKSFLITLIESISPKSNTRVIATIKQLQKKISIFDNAKNVIETYLKSNRKTLSKSKIVSLFDNIDQLENKINMLSNSLTKVQQYAIRQANEEEYLTANAEMYTVEYYRKLGEEYGYNTNELETVKKFFSGVFLTTAKLNVLGTPLNKFPRKLLYKIAYATLHHNFHQQNCNNGEWVEGLKQGDMKEVINLLGYSSKYTE